MKSRPAAFRFVLAVVNCRGSSTSIRANSPAAWANVSTLKRRDRFMLINDLGDLILAQSGLDGYKEISQPHVIQPTHRVWERILVWSHPAFANRCVYHRNDKEIISTRSQVFEHYVGRTLLSVSPRSTDKSVRPTFFDSARKHVSGYLCIALAAD